MITIKFGGAAKTVTGSNYVVETDNAKFAVDCGMFQGPDVEHRNLEDFDYDPRELDFVFLTHAHIDHSGMIPKLIAHGFDGPIYATNHTIAITTELLLDSAKIQENNYKRGQAYGKHTDVVAMIYNTADAQKAISMFKAVNFEDEFEPVKGVKAKYLRAGHVLGAGSIEVDIQSNGDMKKIIFSGDIGRTNESLIDSFDLNYKSKPDYVLMESLYGGQFHPNKNDSMADLFDIVNQTIDRGGNVFIPAFSLQRTQLLLNEFKKAKQKNLVSKDIPFYLDSPLAQRVTNIYVSSLQHTEENMFDFPKLSYVKKHKHSVGLSKKSKQVIIAGSGMADGGRIMQHLSFGLENKKNAVTFVGYQAEGTLGRELVDGAKEVMVGSRKVKVKAKIHYLHGLSAHGDQNDYMNWLNRFRSDRLKKIFLVHAEEDRASAMKDKITQEFGDENLSYIPGWKETFELK
jgi:metallo-beta-lactamase family protein